ncbi:MAG TPA: hypothetical protein VJ348_03325, partial [Candidatus Humimicrobiaceae bacterium]|nr:hypothetical protein [Candidatus Humimicrobiaceae bacterium]
TVKLKDNTGSVIDSVSYSDDPGIDVSLGKCSDKNDSWGILTNSSPGESNSLCMVIPSLTPTVYITLTVKPKPSSTPTPIVTQKFVTAVKEQVIKSTSDTLKKTTTPILSYVNKIVEEGNISTEAGNTILGKTVEISPDYSREPDAQFLLQKSRINQSVPILIFSGFCLLTASVIWSVYIAKLNRSR